MDGFERKRIADPVHGTMGFSELELDIIHAKSFQRLRNVKQLGLAYYVYPGADYSRFSHSLGVCHVTGMILESLRRHCGAQLNNQEVQEYRLAGLLHDVGHYPFSHAMEDAIENYSRIQFVEPLEHESVSEEVVKSDTELTALISSSGYSPSRICSIFSGHRQRNDLPPFCNVVSSELDADRINYLLRTAHQSGLPYGSVDLQYLLSQLRLDSENRVCLTSRAVRTAEHLLLCRYFDYQQISYHKAVASLEWALKEVLAELLKLEMIRGTADWVRDAIKSGEWSSFDDPFVTSKIIELRSRSETSPAVIALCDAVLKRNPPKLLAEIESIEPFSQGDGEKANDGREVRERYKGYLSQINSKLERWASESGIEPRLWYVRYLKPKTITKSGPQGVWGDPEEREQAIRIQRSGGLDPIPLIEYSSSLMSVLAQYALYSIRIYVTLPYGINKNVVTVLQRRIFDDLPDLRKCWK